MQRRYWLGLVVVVLAAIVAGGVDLGGHDSGAYLDVQPGPDTETVEFETFTPDQQRIFEDALDDADNFVRIPDDVDWDVWIEHRYVRYDNERYEVAVAVS